MNCFIWILLLLGCGGNCGNNSCCANTNCGNNWNRRDCDRCNCERCNDPCDNMIQPRTIDDCGCRHHQHHNDIDCMTPPPVPRRVMQEEDCDCGCNN